MPQNTVTVRCGCAFFWFQFLASNTSRRRVSAQNGCLRLKVCQSGDFMFPGSATDVEPLLVTFQAVSHLSP